MQFFVDIVDGSWLLSWILKSDDHGVEPLMSLDGCLIAVTIWNFYAAFIAVVGLYGSISKKRFMKNFMKPQSFVWVANIAISVWNIDTYYRFNKEKSKLLGECRSKMVGVEETRLCRLLMSFEAAPLPDVWVSFILDTIFQTAAFFFLYHYRNDLIRHKPVAAERPIQRESQIALIQMPSISATRSRHSDETLAENEDSVA
ncbi:hypothetical protein Agabi119p4_1739 [Agaricus bisporus var. burnettii]|uniref:Uncharacterized protein n=1 Tax=Agaricus bisporus var. burnettii TaxID=192524 RepID=A0A8H7F7Y0_AGABI|nr:hypothetical protein Agabi119p4_1739 [Agaricus bisporus var. burnettii]